MARFEKHCEECKREYGKEFAEVHKWLDEYTKLYPVDKYNEYHRKFRHNIAGLEKIEEMWGKEARCAAVLHIITDIGYIPYWKPIKGELD